MAMSQISEANFRSILLTGISINSFEMLNELALTLLKDFCDLKHIPPSTIPFELEKTDVMWLGMCFFAQLFEKNSETLPTLSEVDNVIMNCRGNSYAFANRIKKCHKESETLLQKRKSDEVDDNSICRALLSLAPPAPDLVSSKKQKSNTPVPTPTPMPAPAPAPAPTPVQLEEVIEGEER